MAEDGLFQNTSSSLLELLPKGPTLIDDDGCRCALQEELHTEAWRCIADLTDNIYSGQTGKWFFAVNKTNRNSLKDSPNSDKNPPNLTRPYIIKGNGQDAKFAVIAPSDEAADLEDASCSGRNDTQWSSTFYRLIAISLVESSSPCWQPGIIPLTIQNASEWNTTGCNRGFLCKYPGPIAQRFLGKDTYKSAHRRPEQLGTQSTNLLSTASPNPRSQVGRSDDNSNGTL